MNSLVLVPKKQQLYAELRYIQFLNHSGYYNKPIIIDYISKINN